MYVKTNLYSDLILDAGALQFLAAVDNGSDSFVSSL